MIKAVIFDMYETLITHYEIPLYFGKQIAEDMGIDHKVFRKVWEPSEIERTLGYTTFEETIEKILIKNDIYDKTLFNKIINKRKNCKKECFNHLHEDIIPMFNVLKEMGIKIALITNCYNEEKEAIEKSVLYPYFDVVCMSCDLHLKKPDVMIFEKCLEKLNLNAEECIYVGDGGSHELDAALKSGMHPYQALWYLKDNVGQPTGRIDKYEGLKQPLDLIRIIKKEKICE